MRFRKQLWLLLTEGRLLEPSRCLEAGEQGVRIKAAPEGRKQNRVRWDGLPYFCSFFIPLFKI